MGKEVILSYLCFVHERTFDDLAFTFKLITMSKCRDIGPAKPKVLHLTKRRV